MTRVALAPRVIAPTIWYLWDAGTKLRKYFDHCHNLNHNSTMRHCKDSNLSINRCFTISILSIQLPSFGYHYFGNTLTIELPVSCKQITRSRLISQCFHNRLFKYINKFILITSCIFVQFYIFVIFAIYFQIFVFELLIMRKCLYIQY